MNAYSILPLSLEKTQSVEFLWLFSGCSSLVCAELNMDLYLNYIKLSHSAFDTNNGENRLTDINGPKHVVCTGSNFIFWLTCIRKMFCTCSMACIKCTK